MASHQSLQAISTLYELSKQVIIDYESDIRFEQQLPVACIPDQDLTCEWLRDVALRNMFRHYGLESDPQRMRELVGGKAQRLYCHKIVKDCQLLVGYQKLAGQEYVTQSPIDLIDPGSHMTEEHRHFMHQLRAQGFRFNTYEGRKLVLRAIKQNNIDFVRYALKHRFNVCAYQQEIEQSLSYKILKDYCEDILLPFLTTHSDEPCKDFVPVIHMLIKAGAKVRQVHIDQAAQAHNSKLKNLFVYYFKKEQLACTLSDVSCSLVPFKHKQAELSLRLACNEPLFYPAALDYLKQERIGNTENQQQQKK